MTRVTLYMIDQTEREQALRCRVCQARIEGKAAVVLAHARKHIGKKEAHSQTQKKEGRSKTLFFFGPRPAPGAPEA